MTKPSVYRALFALAIAMFVHSTSALYGDDTPCFREFMDSVTPKMITEEPDKALRVIVETVCMPNLNDVPNIVKPNMCFGMANFAVKYLKEATAKKEDIAAYAANFCDNIEDAAAKRLDFVNSIFSVAGESNFMATCTREIEKYPNWWFLPNCPNELLTNADVCLSLDKLFVKMLKKKLTTLDDAVIYTMILTYEIDYTATEQILFETCVDGQVKSNPVLYSEKRIAPVAQFTFWTDKKLKGMSDAEARAVRFNCSDPVCYPCATLISGLFVRYLQDLRALQDEVLKEISMRQAGILNRANSDAAIEQLPKDAHQTTKIMLPTGIDMPPDDYNKKKKAPKKVPIKKKKTKAELAKEDKEKAAAKMAAEKKKLAEEKKAKSLKDKTAKVDIPVFENNGDITKPDHGVDQHIVNNVLSSLH